MSLPIKFNATILKECLNIKKYRTILSYPTWDLIQKAVISTRSYQESLDAGLLLLKYTELNKDRLTEHEFEENIKKLFYFILEMLDRLDQWEEYIETWESVRKNTKLSLTYTKNSLQTHGIRMKPFIMKEDEERLYVHFLWTTLYRKELICRKIDKKKKGRKIGNLTHASQNELSNEEIQKRFEWIVGIAKDYANIY